MRTRSSIFGLILFLAAFSVMRAGGVGVTQVEAATIAVTTVADELNSDGDCSLREAIQAANTDSAVDSCPAGSGADIITLPTGTYKLSVTGAEENNNATGDLDIKGDLTINGAGAASTIIKGGADRVLDIHSGFLVTVNNVTVTSGNPGTAKDGGGIRNRGTLTLNNSTVSNNSAGDSLSAEGGASGGGIQNDLGTLILNDTTVSGNSSLAGGGIDNKGGIMLLNRSTISDNRASGYQSSGFGGGISNSGTTIISNSTVSGNFSFDVASGIRNLGTLTINSSTI